MSTGPPLPLPLRRRVGGQDPLIGPLDGLPIGVKDLQNTKGLLTTHGSIRARRHIPDDDLPMVARLRAAGAIILAKTNVPEMGAGGNSRNRVWGATGNPFDANLIAGGSSGGSAAALGGKSLALVYWVGHGWFTRMPAALCGVVGYRPSVDVIAHPTRPLGLVRYFGSWPDDPDRGRSDFDFKHFAWVPP